MKFVKYLFLAVLGIFGVYLVICLLGEKSMKAEESVMMKGTPDMAYEEVVSYKNWTWSPWKTSDSTIVETLSGPESGVGARSSWTSENSGDGYQEIVEAVPGKSLKMTMNFGMQDNFSARFLFEQVGDSTKTTWFFDEAPTPFLGRGIMTMMNMNKTMSNMYKLGLKMLKDKVESKKPAESAAIYEIVDVPEIWYVGKTFKGMVPGPGDAELFSKTYAEIVELIGGPQNIGGSFLSIAHNYNDTTKSMDLEIAVPVTSKIDVKGDYRYSNIPAGKCAKYLHKGSYDSTPDS
ncbi:MAG: SRPBCC family protein [Flavobacteriales bacterium]|nr:SRPBCC family protein [Flavobacteriales bacterium]